MLLTILFSQPVTPIFAAELSDTPPQVVQDSSPSDTPSLEVQDSSPSNSTLDVLDAEMDPAVENPNVPNLEEEIINEPDTSVSEIVPPVEEAAHQNGEALNPSDSSDTPSSEATIEPIPVNSDDARVTPVTVIPEEVAAVAADTEQVVVDDVVDEVPEAPVDEAVLEETEEAVEQTEVIAPIPEAEPTAPTIEEVSSTTNEVLPSDPGAQEGIPPPSETIFYGSATNDTNRFSFSVNECVPMGSETFFCSKQDGLTTSGEVTGVISLQSSQGNKEIFIVTDATNVQITDNLYDDEAPYYDATSNTIVWHRSIDGRYQIVEHNMDTSEERILTNEDYNSMYPSRYGDTIVWQGWVGENWEIFLEESGDIRMITENLVQDIAPRINDNYIIWQAFEDGIWKVKVYDRASKHIETVADSDGASAQNPRFVLVYDAKQENGDVETRGYDLSERTSIPLSSMPAPLPKDLPAPEQTGEERALVNQTPQVKNKLESSSDNNNDPNSNASSTDSIVVDEVTDDTVLIVPPYATSTTSETLADEADTDVSTTTDESLPEEDDISTSTPSVVTHEVTPELEQFDIVVPPFDPSVLEPVGEQESI